MSTTLVQGELRPDVVETANTTSNSIAKPAESIDQAARRDATVWELAVIIAGSRDFPECRSPEKAAVRILAGKECGIGPIASVMGIRFQNGRQSMDASLVAGVIQRSGTFDYRVTLHTNEACTLEFLKAGKPIGESGFSWPDAEKAGLAKKDTWRSFPRNMLFARALTNGARWYCPGLFNGAIYSHEELGYSVDEDGHATSDNGSGSGSIGGGSDLCSRETRAAIRALLAEIGVTEADYCKNQGIKLLDEFSQYEADKAIKGLQKTAAKKAVKEGAKAATETAAKPAKEEPREPVAGTGQDAAAPAPETTDKPLTAAQQTLQDGFDESKLPSTEAQHNAIRGLAELLEIDAATMRAVIHKRAPRLIDLSHLQAAALIETMALKYKEATGKDSPF